MIVMRAVTLIVLVAGCGGSQSPTFGSGPISGSSQGATFAANTSNASWNADRSALSISLANYDTVCGAAVPIPPQGQIDVVVAVTLPSADAMPGIYELASTNEPTLIATNYGLDSTGVVSHTSTTASNGFLRVDQLASGVISGAITVSDSALSLSGTFSASLCAP